MEGWFFQFWQKTDKSQYFPQLLFSKTTHFLPKSQKRELLLINLKSFRYCLQSIPKLSKTLWKPLEEKVLKRIVHKITCVKTRAKNVFDNKSISLSDKMTNDKMGVYSEIFYAFWKSKTTQHPLEGVLLCVFLSCKSHQSSHVWANQQKMTTYGVQMMCQVNDQKGDFRCRPVAEVYAGKNEKMW